MKRIYVLVMLLTGLALLAALAGPIYGMDAQKIAELKQGANQTLWQFLKTLPTSFEAQVFYGLFGAGITGMLGSWLWKVSQGQADWYHFSGRYLLGQVLWLGGSAIGAIFTVGFSTESGEFFGWLAVLWSGGLAGFSGDIKVKNGA